MNVHLITVAYGLAEDTDALIRHVLEDSAYDVTVHLFLHSQYDDVVKVCKALNRFKAVTLYDYGVNRGLAKSLNEGLVQAYGGDDPADVVIVSNDDFMPDPGAFDLLAEASAEYPEAYMLDGVMEDVRTDSTINSGAHFCAIARTAYDQLGMFDENFFPIYYDDIDYRYRAQLLGLEWVTVDGVTGVHRGSATIHTVPGMKEQHHKTFTANRLYYMRKWGGHIGQETFRTPFDQSFGLKIDPAERDAPYGRFDRTDQDIVRF